MITNLKLSFLAIMLVAGISTAKAQAENAETTAKIQKLLKARYSDCPAGDCKFVYNAIDLNDDGKNEYLVGLLGSYYCGRAGCKMLLLSNTFKVVTSFTIVQFPVYVGPPASKEVTKGYSNLYVSTGGKGMVKLMWNGKTYPSNPSLAPAAPKGITDGKFAFLDAQHQTVYDF
jgi:hypothetical protein